MVKLPWRRSLAALLVGLASLPLLALTTDRQTLPSAVALAAPAVEGSQWLGADQAGRVFLLQVGDTLAVYPVLTGGRVGAPDRLQVNGVLEGPVEQASMGGDGDWLLSAGNSLHLFEDGRERPLPLLNWQLTSVALDHQGAALAGVVPVQFGPVEPLADPRQLPLVVRAEGRQWKSLVASPLARPVPGKKSLDVLFANHSTRLAVDPRQGDLWVARPFAGRLVRLSAAGRPELEIVLGQGRPSYRADVAALQRQVEEQATRAGYRETGESTLVAFTARLLIRGMTVARDGVLYFLQDSPRAGEALLSRYDSSRSGLETTSVRFPFTGDVSLAMGRDGLYVAAMNNSGGLWRIDGQALAEAPWSEAIGVRTLSASQITSLR